MKAICSICKRESEDIRINPTEGGWGIEDVQTCQECHDKEYRGAHAEAKCFGYRSKVKPWSKLTTRGRYSEVR